MAEQQTDETEDTCQLVYEQGGVFAHKNGNARNEDVLIAGKMVVCKRDMKVFVEWQPEVQTDCSTSEPNTELDWTQVNAVGYKSHKSDSDGPVGDGELRMLHKNKKLHISIDVRDLKSYKLSKKKEGWEHITFIQRDGTTHPPLHFHSGGVNEFVEVLRQYVSILKSRKDRRLFLVSEHEMTALQKSFHELQLFGEQSTDLVNKIYTDPYTATMSGLAKVRNFLWDNLVVPETRPRSEVADILLTDPDNILVPGLMFDRDENEPEFELICCTELPPRVEVSRSEPFTAVEWEDQLDAQGRIDDWDHIKNRVFKGGISHSLRGEVWKLLLNYYRVDSTSKERTETRKQKLDDYFRMKLQWKSISADQESHFSVFRDYKSLIEKDTDRTDRTHPFYQGPDNANIAMLYDVLMTYCMYNFDLGYVQGMSDLLAPILVILENEVDAFWCFVGFMEKVKHNFDLDQQGMKTQLKNLSTLLHFSDNQLFTYLESNDSGNLYFCFRWVLIIFKREFIFADIMRLWEVLWTDLPCENFHLLICLAILDTQKHIIIENQFGFTEILKHINDLSLSIDLELTLKKAEAIFLQLKECPDTPKKVREVIGLEGGNNDSDAATPEEDQNELIHDQCHLVTTTEHRI
ncbi:PREDICTED: TBC1 domain family member 15-like [Priapulus caudatus]|uniref:TBC1 domain family member 15-like n=1 Tax=Priapulus caudatus TaxID=37621 RepID=A0ABM1DW59_PRICU|nr:PREDICTED: TBC1 domain family member 15-like [Priapulus caudatus]